MFDDRLKDALEQLNARLQRHLEAELRAVVDELSRACQDARTAADQQTEQAVAAVEARLSDTVRRASENVETRIADAVRRAEEAAADRLARELQQQRDAADERLSTAITCARVDEREAGLAGTNRLLEDIQRLDAARSLTEVLDALVDAASLETARVVLLIAQNGRLRGWRMQGFDRHVDMKSIDLPIGPGGVVGDAATFGRPCFAYGRGPGADAVPSGLDFATLPENRVGFAMPVHVGGHVAAVLYADDVGDAERGVPAAWPETIEILTHHAARCLEALVIARTGHAVNAAPRHADTITGRSTAPGADAGPEESDPPELWEARRYARLLVSDIKLFHEPAVRAGRQHRDLLQRLGPQIERARRLYEQRVPSHIAPVDVFEQELVRTLADGDAALLGA